MNSSKFQSDSNRPNLSVLLVTPQLEVGGAEKQVISWAKALQHHNIPVAVVSKGGPLLAELEESGIPHYQLPVHSKQPLQIVRNGLALRRLIQERKANVIHAQSLTTALAGRLALFGKPGRLITTVHLITPENRRANTGLLHRISDLILTCSYQMREELIALGVPAKAVKSHPNSIDLTPFQSNDQSRAKIKAEIELKPIERLIIITVARLEPNKGHTFLLAAAARLKQNRPELNPLFLIVGDGSTRPALERQIKELGLGDAVRLLGERHNIAALLSVADIFVLPSVREGLPLAIIEALAAGLPVVASAVDGVPELVQDKVTGRLVEPGKPDALEEALGELLTNDHLRQEYGQAGRRWAMAHYDTAHSINGLIEHYQSLFKAT